MVTTKIGKVWVDIENGEIIRVHGTGLEPETVDIVREDVGTYSHEYDESELLDPFELVLRGS